MRIRMMAAAMAATACAVAGVTGVAAQGGVSGGGGTGGGSGGGGTVTPAPVPTSCATITGFSSSTGYYSVWAAIWSKYSISALCGIGSTWQMSYLNGNTGAVDFVRGGYLADGSTSGTVDEDWAAFSTPYTVTLTIADASGTAVAQQSALVTTKPGKTPGA